MRLSEKAYRLIKEKIIILELPPSSVIDEQVLMEDLDLGRTPIREALQRLDCEGLVNVIPRRGTFVSDVSITDLQRIFELRIPLERLCARLATQRITEEQIAQMELLLQDLKQVRGEDCQALMSIDKRFHTLLYQSAHNKFLDETLNRFHDLSLRLWYLVLDRLGDVRDAIEQHRAIAEAVKAGDSERAELLIQRHIVQFQESIKSAL